MFGYVLSNHRRVSEGICFIQERSAVKRHTSDPTSLQYMSGQNDHVYRNRAVLFEKNYKNYKILFLQTQFFWTVDRKGSWGKHRIREKQGQRTSKDLVRQEDYEGLSRPMEMVNSTLQVITSNRTSPKRWQKLPWHSTQIIFFSHKNESSWTVKMVWRHYHNFYLYL